MRIADTGLTGVTIRDLRSQPILEAALADGGVIDMEGVSIYPGGHDQITKLMVEYGLSLINLNPTDSELIQKMYNNNAVRTFDTIDDLTSATMERFQAGDVAILEYIAARPVHEKTTDVRIVKIESYNGRRITVISPYANMCDVNEVNAPGGFFDRGGWDSSSICQRFELSMEDIHTNIYRLKYGQTEIEKEVLEVFTRGGK
jgi:hypothetical protein